MYSVVKYSYISIKKVFFIILIFFINKILSHKFYSSKISFLGKTIELNIVY